MIDDTNNLGYRPNLNKDGSSINFLREILNRNPEIKFLEIYQAFVEEYKKDTSRLMLNIKAGGSEEPPTVRSFVYV